MGFTIDYNYGPFGILLILLAIGAGVIVVTWLLAAARQDRRDILDEDADKHPHQPDL
jgi:hypothetical protein